MPVPASTSHGPWPAVASLTSVTQTKPRTVCHHQLPLPPRTADDLLHPTGLVPHRLSVLTSSLILLTLWLVITHCILSAFIIRFTQPSTLIAAIDQHHYPHPPGGLHYRRPIRPSKNTPNSFESPNPLAYTLQFPSVNDPLLSKRPRFCHNLFVVLPESAWV